MRRLPAYLFDLFVSIAGMATVGDHNAGMATYKRSRASFGSSSNSFGGNYHAGLAAAEYVPRALLADAFSGQYHANHFLSCIMLGCVMSVFAILAIEVLRPTIRNG